MKLRIAFLVVLIAALSAPAMAQCGKLAYNPLTGMMDCTGIIGQQSYVCDFSGGAVSSVDCHHSLGAVATMVTCYDTAGNVMGGVSQPIVPTDVCAKNGACPATTPSTSYTHIAFSSAIAGYCTVATGISGGVGPTGTNGSGFSGRGTYASMTGSSPAANDTWELTDAAVTAKCGAGSGTAKAVCVYNGSAWVEVAVGTVASSTATLGTGAISANSCATAVSVAATGVATTDVIQWTPNADISGVTGYGAAASDGLIIYPYPTSGYVNFKVCNGTGSSITPGAVTLNWRVTR
jgi:hypothetical protein